MTSAAATHFARIFRAALEAREAGVSDTAVSGFRRAMILAPSNGLPVAALGSIERSLGNTPGAIVLLGRAAAAAPLDPSVQYMRANAQLEAGDLEAGRRGFRRSLAIQPGNAQVLGNLGQLEIESANHPAAEQALSRALVVDPDSGVAASLLGEVRLARGDFKTGWPLYFARMRTSYQDRPPDGLALWNGKPLGAGGLLLRADGGLGDVLMHARFMGRATANVGRVALQCHDPLVDLLRGAFGSVAVTGELAPLASADAWLPLSMLAMRTGAGPETPGHPADYLAGAFPPPTRRSGIGLCWSGQAGSFRQRKRILPASAFDRLVDLEGLDPRSLQVGLGESDPRPALEGFDRTDRYLGGQGMIRMARDMLGLDLVITVDTYVAHLAGALGIETWVLLPHGPEWRWGTSGASTPWYPRARLFRQPSAGDWDQVMGQVLDALAARVQ
jgi:hypothetical protein